MSTLFTAFEGSRNSSKLVLDKINAKNKLYLKNDKVFSCTQIKEDLTKNKYDKIILLGQKPLIKNKINIELKAYKDNVCLETNYNFNNFKIDYNYKFSTHPGNSYCNNIYYFTLNFIQKQNLKTQVIFIHIPYLKNIDDIDKLSASISNFI